MKENKQVKEGKEIRTVCSAFIKNGNKFLFVYDPFFRLWRVPGGKLEVYEKVEDCVVREVKEETDLNAKHPKFIGFGQDVHVVYLPKGAIKRSRLLMFFRVEVKSIKDIKPDPGEISKYKWLTLEEIKKHSNKEGALEDLFKRNKGIKV